MPAALILVGNDVSHDSRVLREAQVLRELGYDVLVVGLIARNEQQSEFELDGIRVVLRVRPRRLLRRLLRRADTVRGIHRPVPGDRAHAGAATRAHRLRAFLVNACFNLQGAALAWRWAPELVHANDYDTMWIGAAAKLMRGSRLIYDAHELWPDQDGEPGWRPWLIACEWLFLRFADATITVSPGCATAIARRYHVALPTVVRNVPDRHIGIDEKRPDEPPVAVYAGILAPARGIEQAVRALAAVPGLRLRLIGPDAEGFSARIVHEAEIAGVLERIEILPPVPPAEVSAALAGARMGLVLIQPTSLSHRLSLPNKLFEYVAAGVPVLASDLAVIGPLVRDEAIGEVVQPADVDAIAAAMRRLADPAYNAEVRKRVRSFGESVNWGQERRVLEAVYAGLRPQAPRQ
jgi:glycosyltransferase involved in cell wall biosynthesis